MAPFRMTPIRDVAVRRFSHPWMSMALFGPLGLGLIFWAFPAVGPGRMALLFALGLISWTLIEYGLHRFVFHWTEVREPWRTLASGLHMAHHESAATPDLIVAPPIASLGFGSVIYLLFVFLTGSFRDAAVLEAGVFVGYIAYEWVHFMAHRFQPRGALGKYLRKYHLQHHFRDEGRQFGVTSPVWDFVFGTGSLRTGKARSDSLRPATVRQS